MNIDGIIAYSNTISLYTSNWLRGCFFLRLIEAPNPNEETEYVQTTGQVFTQEIKVQAIDNLGLPAKGVKVKFTPLTNLYLSISAQPSPNIFMELDEQGPKLEAMTDQDGYATLDQIKVYIYIYIYIYITIH